MVLYEDRLRYLELPTLRYRRTRGDMIEVYKILHNFYDSQVTPTLIRNQDTRTRGNCMKLLYVGATRDVRKYSFCLRVVNTWNPLPDDVVTAGSINSFKNLLDSHWKSQEAYYNYKESVNV